MSPVETLSPVLHLGAAELRQLALAAGADDTGCVRLDHPGLDDQRADILGFYPRTRSLLSIVCRMNREPIRTPARSVANSEFHRTGEWVNEVAHRIVAALERRGIRAINPPMGFPMEADRWPDKMWVISHKPVAVAAGLGRMGIHRNVIHPKFGNFILLATVLLEADVDESAKPLDFSPCLNCMLCVAACPVGAVKPDGGFDFSACYHHNYREFMGGFGDWVEQVAESRNRADYRRRVTPAETVSMWQSLGFGPNYKAAYCLAVCPAGEDVIAAYRTDKGRHVREVVKPLQEKTEPVYVIRGSDAEAHVKKRYPHKQVRPIRNNLYAASARSLLRGMRLTFQSGPAAGLDATFHFILQEEGKLVPVEATVGIRQQKITVREGLHEKADVTVRADAETWLRFVRGDTGIVGALLRRKVRVSGPIRLLQAFGRCFPK
ncbi:MAG: SCP2 sterol-binding domain-containing protein [Opitutae bacterium]|nr:SCP2 sterol-binding domain-containing protein [Opitutae bacterium]